MDAGLARIVRKCKALEPELLKAGFPGATAEIAQTLAHSMGESDRLRTCHQALAVIEGSARALPPELREKIVDVMIEIDCILERMGQGRR